MAGARVAKAAHSANYVETISKSPLVLENQASGQENSPGQESYELSVRTSTAPIVPSVHEDTAETPVDAKKLARVQFAAFTALSWAMFMQGWNDGTNGPLLPAMQRNYHVRWRLGSFISCPITSP